MCAFFCSPGRGSTPSGMCLSRTASVSAWVCDVSVGKESVGDGDGRLLIVVVMVKGKLQLLAGNVKQKQREQ